MTPEKIQATEARIAEIRGQIAAIPAMLDGTLMAKRNRVKRKDGSLHISQEYFTFQYTASSGKRCWRRIPRAAKAAVEKLVRAGRLYRKLEREFAALLTELALVADSKKND